MEMFLCTTVTAFAIACFAFNIYHLSSLQKKIASLEEVQTRIWNVLNEETESLEETTEKIENIAKSIDRQLLDLKEVFQATTPIKPNNWDSVREAFKGPVRVEINERN